MARKPPGIVTRTNSDGSKSYQVRWRQGGGRDGRRLSHTFDNQRAAIDARARIVAAGNVCHCPEHAPAGASPTHHKGPGPLTFGRAVDEHAAGLTGVGEDYRTRYGRDLRRHFADFWDRPLERIDAADVKRWIRGCEDGTHPWLLVEQKDGTKRPDPLSPVTQRRLLVQAGAIYRDRGLAVNPFAGHRLARPDVDKHEAMKVLTPQEWALIRDALTEGTARDFCTVLVTTGLRFGEAAALQVRDVDLFARELRVRRAWKAGGELGPPKSRKSRRSFDFGQTTLDAFIEHVVGKAPEDWVFTAPEGGPIHASNFHHREWAPALTRAQAAGLTRRPRLHDLRHTAVSWMLNDGVPLFEVSRRVGHESITTTSDRYGHLLPRGSGLAVGAIEKAMGQSTMAG